MFSTPEEGGSLKSQGWVAAFHCGHLRSLDVWQLVAHWATACLALAICLLGLTAWSLQVLSHLWCCQCMRAGCRRLLMGEAAPDHQFEETPLVRGFKALPLTGPTGVRAVDTEFYNKGVRGRGINRKPHDLVIVLDSGVARLQVDQERRSRIDRHGIWIHYSRVLGVSRHLCKAAECHGGDGLHCTAYDALDAEALVDLGTYGRVSAWRLGVLVFPDKTLHAGMWAPPETPEALFDPTPTANSRSRCTEVIGP